MSVGESGDSLTVEQRAALRAYLKPYDFSAARGDVHAYRAAAAVEQALQVGINPQAVFQLLLRGVALDDATRFWPTFCAGWEAAQAFHTSRAMHCPKAATLACPDCARRRAFPPGLGLNAENDKQRWLGLEPIGQRVWSWDENTEHNYFQCSTCGHVWQKTNDHDVGFKDCVLYPLMLDTRKLVR